MAAATSTSVSGRHRVSTCDQENGGTAHPISACAVDCRSASSGTGVGVRDNATARPMVAAITAASTDANRRNAPGDFRSRAGSVRRRCHQPNQPKATSATSLPRTSQPYDEVTSGAIPPRRTHALTSPEKPAAAKHHRASELYRPAALPSAGVVARRPYTARPTRPPTHRVTATMCTSRLEVAMSWSAAPAEWPVSAGGRVAVTARTSSRATPFSVRTPRAVPARMTASRKTTASDRPWVTSETKPARLSR